MLSVYNILIFSRSTVQKLENNMMNTVVSNHVNSDHVPSFSFPDVWNARQTTSGVHAIKVITSAYHSRRYGILQVIVIWRRQGNGWVHTGVWYLTVWYIRNIYIKVDRFPFMMLTAANKEKKIFNFKEVIVSALKSLIQIK